MFHSMFLPEKTQITGFHGRPNNWGSVVRAITDTLGGFTCMTTIGHRSTARIAAACEGGTVAIFDSVTGVLRLSLSPPHPVQAMTGSPDGSILFCTHRDTPSITLWDIQTGGLIHTFTLKSEAKVTAISLGGRYLACALSDGSANFWEVASRTGGPIFGSGSSITGVCWLAPEERLMVADEASIHIRDVVTGSVLVENFKIQDPVYGVAYSRKLNQLAIVTSSGAESTITIIDAQTGRFSASSRFRRRISCFAFSQTTPVLVCGMKTGGLELINVSTWRWAHPDFPATVTSVSTLSNGTVVANVMGSGIQLLSLDEGYAPPQQLLPPTLSVRPLDEGRIIAVVPTSRDRVILLESATMSQVLTIPTQTTLLVPTNRTVVLCASLKRRFAVCCLEEGGKNYLQLWVQIYQYPQWTTAICDLPLVGSISPAGTRLVTSHIELDRTSTLSVRSLENGELLGRLTDQSSSCPLRIAFDSEDRFYSHYTTCCILYDVLTSSKSHTPSHLTIRRRQLFSIVRARERQYCVDDSREWVVRGSQKICWIPPGYIGSTEGTSHCGAGSSLFMAGQDGTLRVLAFKKSLF